MLAFCYCLETRDCIFGPIVYNVRVSLEDTDMVADLFCDFEQLESRMDIGGDTKIGALDGDQAEEVAG